jgi:hypothetical protein
MTNMSQGMEENNARCSLAAIIFEFGDALIGAGDLDPVYVALVGAQLPEPQLSRLLLSYLSFYHLGLAAWLSEHEGENYWAAMLTAAQNDEPSPLGGRWPRASERRHFRGAKCVKAVEWLRNKYPEPEAPVRSLLVGKTEKHVIERLAGGRCLGIGQVLKRPTCSTAPTGIRLYSIPTSACCTTSRARAWRYWPPSRVNRRGQSTIICSAISATAKHRLVSTGRAELPRSRPYFVNGSQRAAAVISSARIYKKCVTHCRVGGLQRRIYGAICRRCRCPCPRRRSDADGDVYNRIVLAAGSNQ